MIAALREEIVDLQDSIREYETENHQLTIDNDRLTAEVAAHFANDLCGHSSNCMSPTELEGHISYISARYEAEMMTLEAALADAEAMVMEVLDQFAACQHKLASLEAASMVADVSITYAEPPCPQ